jgi:hypothetical protein
MFDFCVVIVTQKANVYLIPLLGQAAVRRRNSRAAAAKAAIRITAQ